jgi:hypothetical protein
VINTISTHDAVARSRAYIAPKKRKFELRPEIRHIPKPLASRYYQLISGHTLIGPYMKEKLNKADSDECRWCDTGQQQTREHLFKECPRGRWRSLISGGPFERQWVGRGRGGNQSRSSFEPRKQRKLCGHSRRRQG